VLRGGGSSGRVFIWERGDMWGPCDRFYVEIIPSFDGFPSDFGKQR
jgi:hypothetical protein